jgi:hypothetical protein
MEVTTLYKIIIAVVLLAFWGYGSGTLSANPNLISYVIPFSWGMIAVIAVIIQLVLKKDIQTKMKEMLNAEIKERKDDLVAEINELAIYLEETRVPNYSESGVEGLEDDFREFDSIKSKYTFQPKIINATLLTVISSLVLFVFWANPSLWVAKSTGSYPDITLAYVGLGLLAIAMWIILGILVTSLEIRIWEKERK